MSQQPHRTLIRVALAALAVSIIRALFGAVLRRFVSRPSPARRAPEPTPAAQPQPKVSRAPDHSWPTTPVPVPRAPEPPEVHSQVMPDTPAPRPGQDQSWLSYHLLEVFIGLTVIVILSFTLAPPLLRAKKAQDTLTQINALLKDVDRDIQSSVTSADTLNAVRAHLDATPAPAYAGALREALLSNDATVCFTERPLITSQSPQARYLDQAAPGWREVERRLSTPGQPELAARATALNSRLEEAAALAETLSIQSLQFDLGSRVRAWRSTAASMGLMPCDVPAMESERIVLLLTGLRDTRLNQPAQPLNLSQTREQGFSDEDLLCLSGSYDLTAPVVLAGEHIITPGNVPQRMPRPAPALQQLPSRVITPADLRSAGCSIERQTELASRVNPRATQGR